MVEKSINPEVQGLKLTSEMSIELENSQGGGGGLNE